MESKLISFWDFCSFFGGYTPGPFAIFELVKTGSGSEQLRRAVRSLVAAYLNASWGMNHPYSTAELMSMQQAASTDADFLDLHTLLDTANNAGHRDELYGPRCPISAGGW